MRDQDISVGPSGKELPSGLGTAKEGAAIFEKGCAHCHGVNGESDGQFPALAGKKSPCRELSVRDHDMGLH
ncbi:MAG: hypothetical protein DMG14_28490 [Acidobacteria bacterium]|nr:MAG: hypothetical protein DMG14_28490 [Acidobacteriota bacterium]